ncbi:MAG: DUF86 domain-containing protein [Armatimonadota bacterium]|nr:DUF86 domain-containing protein [Armatimonadota bacterium]
MVVRRESVLASLAELDVVADELRRYAAVTAGQLRADLSLRWTVERGLLAGLSVVFNVADHLLVGAFGIHAESYEDSLDQLARHGVISADLREGFRGSAGFRNVLVHEYTRVDPDRVADMVRRAPDLFKVFAREVRDWLDRSGGR